MDNMHDLFLAELRDLYDAEKQTLRVLPKIVAKAQTPALQSLLQDHLEQTEQHVARLESISVDLAFDPTGAQCRGMQGILEDAETRISQLTPSASADAELVMMAQKVANYGIVSYGSLCEWARSLGYEEALELLKLNMIEEEKADERLSDLSDHHTNGRAAAESALRAGVV